MENSEKGSDTIMYLHNEENSTQGKPVFQLIKESVASGMSKVADAVHQQAEKTQAPQLNNLAHQTAGWLGKSADYVQQLQPEQLRADIERQVRKNPAKSLLIAGAAGLVLGAIFRGRR